MFGTGVGSRYRCWVRVLVKSCTGTGTRVGNECWVWARVLGTGVRNGCWYLCWVRVWVVGTGGARVLPMYRPAPYQVLGFEVGAVAE